MSRNPLVEFLEHRQGAAGSSAAMAPEKPPKKKTVSRSGHQISEYGKERIREAVKKRWAEARASGRTTLKK